MCPLGLGVAGCQRSRISFPGMLYCPQRGRVPPFRGLCPSVCGLSASLSSPLPRGTRVCDSWLSARSPRSPWEAFSSCPVACHLAGLRCEVGTTWEPLTMLALSLG